MKERILESLFNFSRVEDAHGGSPLFKEIAQELNLNAEDLKLRAQSTLKHLLHNYAFFDISTIDKFTHRLIRTFAKDLKLPQNFEVVLDTDLLLDEAVSQLIGKARENEHLTQILIDFALEKIDDSKSWDISYDLKNMGQLLFNENHEAHLMALGSKDIDDFIVLKKLLRQKSKALESKAIALAGSVLQFIIECGLEYADFPRETLPNHFKKIAQGVFNTTTLYNNKLEESLAVGKILKSGVILPSEEIATSLIRDYLKLKEIIYQIAFFNNAYLNSVPLTILNAIHQELKNLQKERAQLPISSFNRIISNEIRNQPAPYIYERLGEKYRHYFIDEFQDTSALQWNNLIPLISNALEGADEHGNPGSLFLVGDAKQAIYRWRGGRAEQFLNLISLKQQPFVIPPRVQDLPTNFRSKKEIVDFNNRFFTLSSTFLNNQMYRELFIKGNQQKCEVSNGGFVQMSFLEDTPGTFLDDLYCKTVLQIIQEAVQRSYEFADICILTRKRKHAMLLSDYLMQHKIPLISSETLLLRGNAEVLFLINLLKYCIHPDDLENTFKILFYLSRDNLDQHGFIQAHMNAPEVMIHKAYGFSFELLKQFSVYDGLEYAIKQFKLAEKSNAYLNFLLDEALTLEKREGSGIGTFINYWDKHKDKLTIVAPESMNAIRIMTIHKAKGLEFPVVIFPYANTYIYEEINPKLWLPLSDLEESKFSEVLISKKQEVANYGGIAAESYQEEQHKLELDALNLLYVALTRAADELYILTEKDLTAKGEHKPHYYSGLFINFLQENGLWNNEKSVFSIGYQSVKKDTRKYDQSEYAIPYQYTFKNRPDFSILTNGGQLWDSQQQEALSKGTALHQLMELIETEEDMVGALGSLNLKGVPIDEVELSGNMVKAIITHPELNRFFQPGLEIKNECDIITENGLILRPDRLVFNGSKVSILDYKTGKKHPKYHEQLYAYADALENMGYHVERKVIIYIDQKINPEFI